MIRCKTCEALNAGYRTLCRRCADLLPLEERLARLSPADRRAATWRTRGITRMTDCDIDCRVRITVS
jgi:hypothetical protein